MIGAYTKTPDFAYPGWRLTVPGGPAGGHYKGFTHTQAAGTDIPPGDSYEQDREDGMSSHDAVHASPANPRGVYRSSGEVPPRPNASGSAMTYRGFQTQRHPGTSVAPGSFPADFSESDEDAFLQGYEFDGLGYFPVDGPMSEMIPAREGLYRPNVVAQPYSLQPLPVWSGATSVVRQAPPSQAPGPSAIVPVFSAPPVSPQPSPIVATRDVIPQPGGGFVRVSDGSMVAASDVVENPASGVPQVQPSGSGFTSWLTQHSIFSSVPNWGVLAGGGLVLFMFMGGRRR